MRLILLLALLTVPAWGQALSVGCTKATQGSAATCTGSGGTGPYTYSVSAGSGSIGASDGVYTPPTTVEVKQKVGPCQLLPPDHIYNTRVDGLPAHADSNTIIARGSTDYRIEFQSAVTFNTLVNSTPTFDAVFAYTPSNNGAFQILDWPAGRMQSGWFTDYFAEDRHILAVNRETCEFSDLYNKYPAGANGPAQNNCPLCTSQSGVKYFSDFSLPTSGATDAAGMALQPVTLRLSDIQSGVVRHALRFTLANSLIESGVSTNFQWPALTGNSTPTSAAPSMKYGMYVRLKSSVDISSYSAVAQIILTGLKHYGMILTDGGTNWAISTSNDLSLDKDARAALKEIYDSALRNDDFEVVDTSTMEITATTAPVNLSNGYVTPSQYAEVTVTDSVMATATTRVNLAGIVVGTPEPTMTIMAGHTVTPTWWVTGTATQTVTCTMSPDVGDLDSSTCEFTPDSTTTPLRTRITITSTVEATAQAFIDVVVWPDNASGNIYADWGRGDTASKTYDTKTFWPDEWTQAEGWNGIVGQTTAGGDIFTNVRYFLHDTLAKWYLPNGNYKVRVYVRSNAFTSSTPVDPDTYQIHYESQGKLIYRNYSIGRATGGLHQTGGYLDLPLDVTDGSGTLAFRHLSGGTSYPFIAAIAIEADASDPHLTIDDPTTGADITISQTRQFYAIGWYMDDSVTWSVQSGPGSIDEDGLYTAASTPPSSPQTVTVRATSTVDGMVYAEVTFDFVFGTVAVSGPASVSRGQTAQFSASIGGVSYTNVTWGLTGAQGSVNPSTGLVTAPGSISPNETVVVTATPNDMGGSAGNANLDLVQLIDTIRFYANSSSNLTDGNSNVWSTHPGPCSTIGSGTIYTGDPGPISGLPVSGQQNLYIGRFYRGSSGTIGYSCQVPNGRYRVTFKHANAQSTNLKAKMNLKLEGVTVAANFDVTAAAGAVLTAFDHTYTTVVTDGALTIEAEGLSNAPSQSLWAMLMGIQIEDLGPIVGQAIISGGVTLTGGVVVQ